MNIEAFLQDRNFVSDAPSLPAVLEGVEQVEIPCLVLACSAGWTTFSYLGDHYRIATSDIVDVSESRSLSCLPGSRGYPLMMRVRADAEITVSASLTAYALAGCRPAIFTLPHCEVRPGEREAFVDQERNWLLKNGIVSMAEVESRQAIDTTMTKGDSTPIQHDTNCWGSASGEGEDIHIDDSHQDDTREESVLDPLVQDW